MERQPRTQPEFLEHACIATRMLDKRRQLFDLKQEFHAQRSKYDEQCAILRQKEEFLSQRVLVFQDSIVEFELLSKEHESKCESAAKRIAEEVKRCEMIDKESMELLQLLEEKRADEHRFRRLVDKKKRYHDVVKASADHLQPQQVRYTEAFPTLTRYELLKETNEQQEQTLERLYLEIMSHREELDRLLVKETLFPRAEINSTTPGQSQSVDAEATVYRGLAVIAARFERRGTSGRESEPNDGNTFHRSLRSSVDDKGDTDNVSSILETIYKIAQHIRAYSEIVEKWQQME